MRQYERLSVLLEFLLYGFNRRNLDDGHKLGGIMADSLFSSDATERMLIRGALVALYEVEPDDLMFRNPQVVAELANGDFAVAGPGPEWTPYLLGRWAVLHDDATLAEFNRRIQHRDGSSAAIAAAGELANLVASAVEDFPAIERFIPLSGFTLRNIPGAWREFPFRIGARVALSPVTLSLFPLDTIPDSVLAPA